MGPQQSYDYYAWLGLDAGCTDDAIKRAYRRIAIEFHPDRNPGDQNAEEQFKKASEAYSVLSDPERRRLYDRFGAASGNGHDRSRGWHQNDFTAVTGIIEGFFDEVFRGRKRARPGNDLRYDLEISFEEAALGTEREIVVPRPSPNGTDTQYLTVKIPPGVEQGSVRSIRGAGELGLGGPGDLHVYIQIAKHPFFQRNGADVLCTVPVTFSQAVLGTELEIPTLHGSVRMHLPNGTQSGKVFRLRGKGIPVFGGYGRGDQLVKIVVEVPEQLNARQRRAIEELQTILGEEHYPQRRGFIRKLRRLV